MPGSRKRRIYPMPVEDLYDHPDFIAMPAAGRGITASILLHFWVTECRPLPIADHELRAIGRAHAPTWRHWKPHVMAVVQALAPIMAQAREYRMANKHRLAIGNQKLRQLAAERRAGRDLDKARSSLEPIMSPTFSTPQRDPAPLRPPVPEKRAARPLMSDRA